MATVAPVAGKAAVAAQSRQKGSYFQWREATRGATSEPLPAIPDARGVGELR